MIETDIVLGSGMKISVPRDELAQRLGIVARAVSTRTAVQVLLGVLLRAEEGRLHLAATDMELSLRASLEADVDGDGAAVVPGRLLVDLVRQLPGGEVTIEHRPEEGVVRVESGASQSRLNSYGVEDFPRLPGLEGVQTFTVAREPLLATVAQVSRAASRDESRPVLTGILVRLEGGKLVMAATDSYRLSVKETALGELARIAQSGDEIEMGLHENQIVFLVDGVTLTSRRIDGQFPNYRQLVPESFEHVVHVPRAELLEVVRRTAVIVQRNSPLRLRFPEGELTVSAQTQDVGESRETLPVAYDAEPLEIGFNAEFLREGIESVGGGELRLKLISPLRPAVLQGEGDDFTYLLMPIRLAG